MPGMDALMIIGEEIHDLTHVIVLVGRLDAFTCVELAGRIDVLIATGSTRLLLDCEGLTHVTSVGLRVLLVGAKKTKAAGGALSCCRLQPAVREAFVLSRFDTVMAIHPDRTTALQALT